MNIDNNQRYKDTEKKIISAFGRLAFKKSVDKITVSDICKEAQIHRTTFYGHFQDVFELQLFIETVEFKSLLDSFITEEGWDLKKGILAQLNFFYEYQDLMRRNLSVPAIEERLDKVFFSNLGHNFNESYSKHFNLKTDIAIAYHQRFISAGSIAIIKKWIFDGCKETPEQIADVICELLQ